MKLLQIIPTLDPRGGGPMEALLHTGLACMARGHVMEALTYDAPDAPFLAGYPMAVHAIGPARKGWGYTPGFIAWLRTHAADYDAIVVHGLWNYHGFASWRALHDSAVPYVLYTHGMLDPYFRRAYPLKHLKKLLYWTVADYRLVRDAKAVLFTCEEERRLARQTFSMYRAREQVVAFGTARPPEDSDGLRAAFAARVPGLADKRLLLFLSRIHRKKGCDLLIEAFAHAGAATPDLHLVMAGPDHDVWRPELEALAASVGVADRITWPGMLQGDAKWGAFHAAEAYVLPSHQENFGIAVAEALGCGLPVLISDKVNIWREIDEARAGFVATDTVDGTVDSLGRWLALDAPGRQAMRQRARALFDARFTVDAMAESLLQVIRGVTTPN